MGYCMITCDRTYDVNVIKSVIFDPVIWDCITEDGDHTQDGFDVDTVGECWLVIKNDDLVVAIYNMHALNGVTLQIHAHVLPQYRKDFSRESGLAALRWIINNTDYQKIVATIPSIYDNVKKFTESFGFIVEGINRLSYKKNGNLCSQWLMGVTRGELEWVK